VRPAILALLAAVSTGCATLAPSAHAETFKIEPFGEATAARELNESFKKSMAATFATVEPGAAAGMAKSVKVLQKSLPDGVELKDGVIKTSPESGLEVVSSFRFFAAGGSTMWFADYSSTWRKVLCYPQVPLTWVTLLMWQVFVPLSYPCIAPQHVSIDEGYGYLRVAAEQLHASTVVVVGSNTDETNFFSAEGFILKNRSEAPPAPTGKAPSSI
jgi:hypothetical protein